jgi:hypothetical protein
MKSRLQLMETTKLNSNKLSLFRETTTNYKESQIRQKSEFQGT